MALDMDYIDVAARIVEFRTKHPEGSLQPANPAEPFRVVEIAGQTYIAVVAAAYRTPDDPRPGIAMAYEQFPGKTNFTRGSELQNAETSAWGRAIVAALAADTKRGVASQEEVRNRRAEQQPVEWDPTDQEALRGGWEAEIATATLEELPGIAKRLQNAKRSREMSPATYDHLAKAGAARRAEINGGAP
jgi:hypothetical protein